MDRTRRPTPNSFSGPTASAKATPVLGSFTSSAPTYAGADSASTSPAAIACLTGSPFMTSRPHVAQGPQLLALLRGEPDGRRPLAGGACRAPAGQRALADVVGHARGRRRAAPLPGIGREIVPLLAQR